jgi:Zn-dependent M28 family amino/carboxypeptidase
MRLTKGRRGFRNLPSAVRWVGPAVLVATGSTILAQGTTDDALRSFSGDRMLGHVRVLSSDEYQGRGPGTKGEDLTVSYIEKQFRDAHLEPGNPDGTYIQNVPLVGITADPKMQFTFTGHGKTLQLAYLKDFVAISKHMTDTVKVDAPMVFAGYGVQAPEYQWDDFKGVDMKGKVIVVLVNDPPVTKPNSTELDPTVFGGRAMTYYGRWTYKYEKAAELGAAGCIIVHETGPAGYPFTILQDSTAGEQFDFVTANKHMDRASVEAWITEPRAEELFRAAGMDYATLKKQAANRDFHPIDMGMRASIEIHNTMRTIQSRNVVAKRTGSDPALKSQFVIYTAHWDHLGIGPRINGDSIYHGALDNASGVAALLEIARAYSVLKTPPKRTILFISVTAEEQGLLGSEYYATHPLYPLAKTAAEINMDGMDVWGKTSDITEIGRGESNLDDVVAAVAREQGRTVEPDPEPEKGLYYRSDHFSFAKAGVPAFDPDAGIRFVGKPADYGLKVRQDYTEHDYHEPSDVIKSNWDMSGAVQDCQLYFLVGDRVANAEKMPQWSKASEFRAIREKK